MSITDWISRLDVAVRADDVTPGRKTAFARIFVEEGSGERLEDEEKMFDNATRLSASGAEPAEMLAFSTAVKSGMRGRLRGAIEAIGSARYAVIAAVDVEGLSAGDLIASNMQGAVEGQPWSWRDSLNALKAESGLKVIEVTS